MEMCYDGTLVLPSSYAVMDEEEMTYVEGGVSTNVYWWGISIRLDGNETSAFLSDAGWATGILSAGLGIASVAAGALCGVTLGVYGLMMSIMNRNNSGVTMRWSWIDIARLALPQIVDNY